ncbi:MAG: ATP-binding protein [Xenococcaceae cyanobacterium]
MTNAYQLKPWTQIVTPHPDILEGRLDSSTYAASLGSVVRGDATCPRVYRDAREFFKATYMTQELRRLLEGVLRGLKGEKGDRVLQLRTPFGGGKTHSLVSLYHLVNSRDKLQDFPELATLPDPGAVKTVAFIGLDVGASTGIEVEPGKRILTPWGYMAWEIGGAEAYALVETEDQQRIAPGNDVLRKVFGNDPVLLLLDEFLVYVENAMALPVGDSTFGRQVLTFIQKLTEVVRELPKTVLVYSLQASIQESFGNDGTLNILDKLVSRIDAKKEPVAGDEVMKIIQRRLFAEIGDPTIIEEVARQQAELYRKFRESYEDTSRGKQEVQQQADLLAERIKLSYPFHPDLLDLMYYRWGSLPSYQRTRGALQFLARVVYALRQTQDTSLLISAANIPFQDEGVRGAFFSQVGERERFASVIEADIVGRKAKVRAVDNRIAIDSPALSLMKVGTRVASAILMYSFGAKSGQDRGVLEQEVTSACLAPNLNRNIITATLSDLREELLYLHYVGKHYRFETKPNLNKLIADEESKVAVDEVLEKIRESLSQSLQNARGKVVLWAKDSTAISDRVSQFSVVYLSPDWAEKSREAVLEEALHWLEYRGNDKRDYKNALAFVVPSKAQIDKARKGSRTALAVTSLIEQKAKYKFAAEDIEELKAKVKDANQQIEAALRSLYEYILLPLPGNDGVNPIRLELIDLQSQLNTSQNLQDRVLNALSNHLFDSIRPAKLLQYSGLENPDTEYIKAEELVSFFFRFPTLPKMLDTVGIKKAILKAIEQGLLGYVPSLIIGTDITPTVENPSLISFECKIPEEELDLSGYLLSPKLISKLQPSVSQDNTPETTQPEPEYVYPSSDRENSNKIKTNEEKKTVEYKTDSSSSLERSVTVDIVEGKKPARSYKLNSTVNKEQIFQLFEVLQSLSDKADEMTIQIEVRAHTTKEFDRNWIRNAIEEPLDELDIKASTKLE